MSLAWNGGLEGVTLIVEAALSTATSSYGIWNAGLWDTATWGPDVAWTDISPWVRSITTDRGFSRDVQVWEGGTATITLLNPDGRFSPSNLTGPVKPYVVAGVTGLRPWRPIRVRATHLGVTYDIYRGYALDWLETWDPSDAVATVTVPCSDEMSRLAKFDGLAQSPVGAGESTGARMHRILDNAGHTGARSIDVGRNTVQATDLAKNCVDELKLTTDSEAGGLFIDGDGTVVFERQYALMENARSNSVQATFVDDNNAGLGLPMADATMSYGSDLVRNIVAFARVGSTQQLAVDATSRALYGDLRESRTDLVCETDAQVQALATFYLQLHKDPENRVKQIVVKPRTPPTAAMWPAVLGRRVRDLIKVIRSPRTGSYTITQYCHIAGIKHEITSDDWTTTFQLWSATVYQTYATSRWDVGAFDSAAFFF